MQIIAIKLGLSITYFYAPNFEKIEGAINFGLVIQSIRRTKQKLS